MRACEGRGQHAHLLLTLTHSSINNRLAGEVALEQIAYWEGVLRRVTATPEWAAFLARNHWKPRFMGHAEARRFLDAESASARALACIPQGP